MKTKPLRPEDIPIALRSSLRFDTQRLVHHVSSHFNDLLIDRECVDCGNTLSVPVTKIRAQVRVGAFTGRCGTCSRVYVGHNSRGPKHSQWRGGRRLSGSGYVLLHAATYGPGYETPDKDGYVLEHRKVMADRLGRKLLPSEQVHHKNGIRTDNRAENLELWHGGHPSGQRLADKPHCPTCTCAAYE